MDLVFPTAWLPPRLRILGVGIVHVSVVASPTLAETAESFSLYASATLLNILLDPIGLTLNWVEELSAIVILCPLEP